MRLNKTYKALATSLVLVAAMVSGMVPATAYATSNTSKASSNAGATGTALPYVDYTAKRTTGSLKTFNPHKMQMDTEYEMVGYLAGGLFMMVGNVEKGGTYEYVPYHAAKMAETTDHITWKVTLKDNLKWNDGTPITAADYEYSMKMLLDPKLVNENSSFLYTDINVKNAKEYLDGKVQWDQVGIKAEGNVLTITLEKEMGEVQFYGAFGGSYLVKKDLYEAGMNADKTETTYGTDMANMPTCGPYKMVQFTPDQFVKIDKANLEATAKEDKEYYRPQSIEMSVINSSATRLQEFISGNLDSAGISGNEYDNYKDDPRVKMGLSNTIWGFFVNSETPKAEALKNKNIRQALFWGTNREEISKGIFKTYQPAPYWVGLTSMYGDPKNPKVYRDSAEAKALMPNPNGFDEAKAKELFAKGYAEAGNKPIEIEMLVFDNSESMEQMGVYLQDSWQKMFGEDKIKINIKKVPSGSAYDAYRKGEYDLGVGANGQSSLDPWLSLAVWTSKYPDKTNQFKNEEFDKLVNDSTIGDDRLDQDKKFKNLLKMEQIMIEEVPSIPIFANTNATLFQDNILFPWGGAKPVVGYGMNQASRLQ